MSNTLKLRRGTTTQHSSFTGAEGEVTVDTTKKTLVVHDGSTAGGFPVIAQDASGNVGIGGSANYKLTVNGGGSATAIQLVNTASGTTSADGLILYQDGVNSRVQNTEIGALTFYTSNVEQMRIDSSGNVGIGATTITPSDWAAGSRMLRMSAPSGNYSVIKLDDNGSYPLFLSSGTTSGGDDKAYVISGTGTALILGTSNDANAIILGTTAGNFTASTSAGWTPRPAYFCRAWVNFNGTGTVAIRASGNVSSITDNGTGDYTVNFTNAMPDTNYSVAGASKYDGGIDATAIRYVGISSAAVLSSVMQTSSVRILSGYANGGLQDAEVCTLNVFR